jgi:hypothetical protein
VQAIDIEEAMKDGVTNVEPDELALGHSSLQVVAKNFQLLRSPQISPRAEIVSHDEPASADVLTQIRDFFIVELEKAGLRKVDERVLENFGTAELDDLI